jgi:hypothetical protein
VNVQSPVAATLAATSAARRPRVCFLYIAQAHQVLHSLSVAVELAQSRPDIAVEVAASNAEVLDYARLLADLLGHAPIRWRLLGPAWLRSLHGADGVPMKAPMLAANAPMLAGYDVIVAPERTTAMLRRMGVRARLVYTQHGAGDRAGPFERRLGQFDLVFAAGAKQRDRMVTEGLVAPQRCAVVGYPKFDVVDRLRPARPRLFAEPRPTVLYNPHFSERLGSWPVWGRRILEAFAGQRRFNLIFAPHLRLFGGRSPAEVADLTAFVGHEAIHMDLGGDTAAIDMTYVQAADIYLGDVSSQVYEFLREPRPCVFLNPRHTPWRGDASYCHWRFGAVVELMDELMPALADAEASHAAYLPAQLAGIRETFSITDEPASRRAARAVAGLVDTQFTPPPRPPGSRPPPRSGSGRGRPG